MKKQLKTKKVEETKEKDESDFRKRGRKKKRRAEGSATILKCERGKILESETQKTDKKLQ